MLKNRIDTLNTFFFVSGDLAVCIEANELNDNGRLFAGFAYLIRPVTRLHGCLVEPGARLVEDRKQLVGVVREGLTKGLQFKIHSPYNFDCNAH